MYPAQTDPHVPAETRIGDRSADVNQRFGSLLVRDGNQSAKQERPGLSVRAFVVERGQRGFVRFAATWALHSDDRPSGDALLPCHPQTQVIVWA
jgi:hypothetical protein